MQVRNDLQLRNNTQKPFCNVPSFGGGGAYLNRLTQVIPDTKVSKWLTQLDKNCFQGYVYSMKFKLGTTAQEIQNLCKLQGEDFVTGAYELLTNKMGIPAELKPVLVPQPQLDATPMRYLFNYNVISRNPDLSNLSQAEVFNGLRHELQHFRQNMDIFRHEKLGEKVVDIHVNGLVESQKATIKHLLASMSPEELAQDGYLASEDAYNMVVRCKKHLENNDAAAFDKEFESLAPAFRREVSAFRQKVVNAMGLIKEGTNEAQRAEHYFNDFQNINYFDTNDGIDYAKYLASGIEQEALLAGERAGFEFSGEGCMVRYSKDNFKAAVLSQDSEVQKMMDALEHA